MVGASVAKAVVSVGKLSCTAPEKVQPTVQAAVNMAVMITAADRFAIRENGSTRFVGLPALDCRRAFIAGIKISFILLSSPFAIEPTAI